LSIILGFIFPSIDHAGGNTPTFFSEAVPFLVREQLDQIRA
jgi:hypothetical protein